MTTHSFTTKSRYIGLTVRWHDVSSRETREHVWDALIVWCAQHGFFVGGSSEHAMLIARTMSAHTRSDVSRWLAKQSAVASYRVVPVPMHRPGKQAIDPLPRQAPGSTAPRPAVMEAIANYQQHLLEELQWTVDQIPGICAV